MLEVTNCAFYGIVQVGTCMLCSPLPLRFRYLVTLCCLMTVLGSHHHGQTAMQAVHAGLQLCSSRASPMPDSHAC